MLSSHEGTALLGRNNPAPPAGNLQPSFTLHAFGVFLSLLKSGDFFVWRSVRHCHRRRKKKIIIKRRGKCGSWPSETNRTFASAAAHAFKGNRLLWIQSIFANEFSRCHSSLLLRVIQPVLEEIWCSLLWSAYVQVYDQHNFHESEAKRQTSERQPGALQLLQLMKSRSW